MKTNSNKIAALALAILAALPLAAVDKKKDQERKPGTQTAAQQANAQYIIGASDVLGINVWRETDLSGPVQVRPDGRISLPLLTSKLKKFLEEPRVTVSVIQINSKKIFIVGEVNRAGSMTLTPGLTVLQALGQAGGFSEFANTKKIYVMRSENGQTVKYPVNYKNLLKGRSDQDLTLMAGDTIVVP